LSKPKSFYWHDYETSGVNPRCDRAMQFAGIRTDLDFKQIGKPLEIYCQPANDFLPHPEACLVTGITPQHALEHGIPEAEFFARIHAELATPGSCVLGYNSLRFDDEFTRYGLYRNFFDPYGREWQNGNSRWDLIDLARLTHALRPEGIVWPKNSQGHSSFRLEELTAANGIAHQGAHDALVDVQATIDLARLIKTAQPRLFDYVFAHRDKHHLLAELDIHRQKPVLHVSAKYPASLGCIAVVVPLAMHPSNKNSVLVYDLRVDPTPLLSLSAEQINQRIFTPAAELPAGVERLPIKAVAVNRAPVLVPVNTLTATAREQWQLDANLELQHLQVLQQATGLAEKLAAAFSMNEFPAISDPDQDLYGGFISDHDRRLCEQVLSASPEQLKTLKPAFSAAKLTELLLRYRARNWPQSLSPKEQGYWQEFRQQRLNDEAMGITLSDYRRRLSRLVIDSDLAPEKRAVVDALLDWPDIIGAD